MDIPAELEADFTAFMIPSIFRNVEGAGVSVKRYALGRFPGSRNTRAHYRVSSPDVPQGQAYAAASDIGDWKPKSGPIPPI
jgi:hypothetical protein